MSAPFTSLADRPVDREQLIAAGHHPLDFCEHCERPVPSWRIECTDPACRAKTRERDLLFTDLYAARDNSADFHATWDEIADAKRREDV